MKEQTDSDM